jgi:hypothetical protein
LTDGSLPTTLDNLFELGHEIIVDAHVGEYDRGPEDVPYMFAMQRIIEKHAQAMTSHQSFQKLIVHLFQGRSMIEQE